MNPVPVYEVMTFLNQRSVTGRVVINPPDSKSYIISVFGALELEREKDKKDPLVLVFYMKYGLLEMAPLEMHRTGERWYFCYLCGRSTLNQNKHLKHMKEHGHGLLPAESPAQVYHSNSNSSDNTDPEYDSENEPLINLYSKDLIHGKNRKFHCGTCNETFSRKNLLIKHKRKMLHDTDTLVRCDECGLMISNYSGALYKHRQRNHNPDHTVHCLHCTCKLSCTKSLKYHIVLFHPNKNQARQRPPGEPTRHSATYARNSASEFRSPPDYKVSRTESLPKTAKRRSSKPTPGYKCKKCQKTLKTKRGLRFHMMIHTGELPSSCPYCPMKFRLDSALFSHKKKIHKIHGNFRCPFCRACYVSDANLDSHMMKCHSAPE